MKKQWKSREEYLQARREAIERLERIGQEQATLLAQPVPSSQEECRKIFEETYGHLPIVE